MNELMTLNYKGTDLCAIERDDGLWWVLKDVCAVLGIAKQDSMGSSVDKLADKVAALEAEPGKRWKFVVEKAIYIIVAAVLGYVLARAGLQ